MEQRGKLFGYSYTNCREERALGILSEIITLKSFMQLSSRGCPTGAHSAYLGAPPQQSGGPCAAPGPCAPRSDVQAAGSPEPRRSKHQHSS